MPIYTYSCPVHGDIDEIQRVPEKSMTCPACGRSAERVWRPPAPHVVDFVSGYNHSAGEYFDTKRDRANWMSRTNSVRRD